MVSSISSKKHTKSRHRVLKTNSFVRFLEEFTAWQFAFEIIWVPLAKVGSFFCSVLKLKKTWMSYPSIGLNHFVQVQIRLFWTNLYTSLPKWFGPREGQGRSLKLCKIVCRIAYFLTLNHTEPKAALWQNCQFLSKK